MTNSRTTRKPSGDIELRELRVVMAQRNLKPADLARMARVGTRRISNVLVGNDRSWPIRAAINEALARKIFSKPSPRAGDTAAPQRPEPTKPANRTVDARTIFTRSQ